jgi:O-antigen ligase
MGERLIPWTAAGTFRPEAAESALDRRLLAAGGLTALATGWAVVHGATGLVAVALVAFGSLALVVARPELALMAWFAGILVDGRSLTYHKAGGLYLTEPLLTLIALGLLLRFLAGANDAATTLGRRKALSFVGLLALVMWLPALAGLFARTSSLDYATARNFVLILYVLFAVIAATVTDLGRSYRRWFLFVLVGCTIALLLVATGQTGHGQATSTGAIRVAAYTFTIAFGVAPIVLIAAARERLIRPVYALGGAVPFLVGLVFVNHRSAWLAFMAAAAVLFGKRLTVPVVIGLVAIVGVGVFVFGQETGNRTTFGQEVTRAKTITSTSDPNAQFRLKFWKAAMSKAIDSPVIGNGFDTFPAKIVPRESVAADPFPAPHNSFVTIGYRIGVFPLVLVLAMLLQLIRRGFRASVDRADPCDRAVCSALTGIVVYTGVTSAFNVFLEAPYAGPLFWTAVGLLAYAVYAHPFDGRIRAQQERVT